MKNENFKKHMEDMEIRAAYDRLNANLPELPIINFPSEWGIKITSPFAGATIRFRVYKKLKSGVTGEVSVYLDCFDNLGVVGEPYWEIYPKIDNNGERETDRFLMNDIDGLLKGIEEALESQKDLI